MNGTIVTEIKLIATLTINVRKGRAGRG